MAQMHQSVDIARPLPQVVANPVNDALWDSNLVEVTKISPGPPGVGSRFRSKVRFAGREFELVHEITEYEPNRRPAVKTISGPCGSAASRALQPIPWRQPGHADRPGMVGDTPPTHQGPDLASAAGADSRSIGQDVGAPDHEGAGCHGQPPLPPPNRA